MNLHNKARFYCQERYALNYSYLENWKPGVYSYFFSKLLNEIEQFIESDFLDNSEEETVTYFILMSDSVKDELTKWATFWFRPFLKQGIPTEALVETVLEAQEDFLNFLKNYTLPQYDVPILPYRKIFSKTEYEETWTSLKAFLLKSKYSIKSYHLDYCFSVNSLVNELQQIGLQRVFNLCEISREACYEVDIELMDEMFYHNDTYWTSKTLDWFIYVQGHGLTYAAGDVIEDILARIFE